jgi:hypothetical protein
MVIKGVKELKFTLLRYEPALVVLGTVYSFLHEELHEFLPYTGFFMILVVKMALWSIPL